MCAVYEKYAEYFITESSNRVCGGRHGGSVHLESAGSGDGTGGGYGAVGICACCGRLRILFLLVLDRTIPHLHQGSSEPEGPRVALKRTTMLVLAVTLHNIPEGMAVGVVFAGCLSGDSAVTMTGALALSIGIAIQNFPEGAIISMPLKAEGMKKQKAFLYGMLSGIVEPAAALLTVLASGFIVPALPYLLSFAAGAMIYVVVEELIPEMSAGQHSNMGTVFFAFGFTVMLALDVALG